MYIPDPIELMESRIENLIYEWDKAQKDIPPGSFSCPYCSSVNDYEPIQAGPSPDSAACCYECLSDDMKLAYDEFERQCRRD